MNKTIGTCIYCGKIKAVTLNKLRYIPSRHEGVCEDCEHLTPKQRQRLMVNYKKPTVRKKR